MNCNNCKHRKTELKNEPCYSCFDITSDKYPNWEMQEKTTYSDCAKKDAEIAELKDTIRKLENTTETQALDIKIRDESLESLDKEIAELTTALSQEVECRIELKEKCVAYTELLESLKAKFEAADTMNHELHKVNTELQGKLNVAERALSISMWQLSGMITVNVQKKYLDVCFWRKEAEQQLKEAANGETD